MLTAFSTESARAAALSHECAPTSAALLAQGLTAGALLASALEKERARINLQVACDGPAGGLFVDAGTDGSVRGYIRNNKVYFPTQPGEPLKPERAIGRRGYVNVLRDFGGNDVYRGMVELSAFDLAADLENYFAASEQIETAVALAVLPEGTEPLGAVAGMIVQRLPKGDAETVVRARAAFEAGHFEQGVKDHLSAAALIERLGLGGEIELLADYPLAFRCSCTYERVLKAVVAMGLEEMRSLFAEQGEARATCDFCGKKYVVAGPEFLELIRQTDAPEPREGN